MKKKCPQCGKEVKYPLNPQCSQCGYRLNFTGLIKRAHNLYSLKGTRGIIEHARKFVNFKAKEIYKKMDFIVGPFGNIEITTGIPCPVKCSYCPQGKLKKAYNGPKKMTFKTFQTILSNLPSRLPLHFSGFAEPFVNPNCSSMLLYAHKNQFDIKVFTTLVGMDNSDIEIIKKIPFGKFEVHLPSKEHLEKNLHHDKNYIEKVELLQNNKIKNLTYICFGTVPNDIYNCIDTTRLKSNHAFNTRASNLNPAKGIEDKKMEKIFCTAGRLNRNVVLPDGRVILCCMDYSLKHIIGDLTKENYRAIFSKKPYLDVLDKMKKGDNDLLCQTCEKAKPISAIPLKRKLKHGFDDILGSSHFGPCRWSDSLVEDSLFEKFIWTLPPSSPPRNN